MASPLLRHPAAAPALLAGLLSRSLRVAERQAREEQRATTELAAALHLRPMLAEQTIERLRTGGPEPEIPAHRREG